MNENLFNTDFDQIVKDAVDQIPEKFKKEANNVEVHTANFPTIEQITKMHLRNQYSLLGLYEGVPVGKRGSGYSGFLPDKITIFKVPHLVRAKSLEDLKTNVFHTVWHELGHHFGMDEFEVREMERKREENQAARDEKSRS